MLSTMFYPTRLVASLSSHGFASAYDTLGTLFVEL